MLLKSWLWWLLIVGVIPAAEAQISAYNGACTQGGTQAAVSGMLSTNYQQSSFPRCTVTVYLTGTTTPATIYANSSGGALSNPFTANANGLFLFYASTYNAYDVVMSGTGMTTTTLTGVGVGSGGGGGFVQINPTATQTVTQPTGTTLASNSLNSILWIGLPGNSTDLGVQWNNAVASCVAQNPSNPTCEIHIAGPPTGSVMVNYSTTMSFSSTLADQKMVCSKGVILNYTGSGKAINVPVGTAGGQVGGSIEGCTIRGFNGTGTDGVYIDHIGSFTLKDSYITGFQSGDGVTIAGADNALLLNNVISHNNVGLALTQNPNDSSYPNGTQVIAGEIDSNTTHNVTVAGGANNTFNGVTFNSPQVSTGVEGCISVGAASASLNFINDYCEWGSPIPYGIQIAVGATNTNIVNFHDVAVSTTSAIYDNGLATHILNVKEDGNPLYFYTQGSSARSTSIRDSAGFNGAALLFNLSSGSGNPIYVSNVTGQNDTLPPSAQPTSTSGMLVTPWISSTSYSLTANLGTAGTTMTVAATTGAPSGAGKFCGFLTDSATPSVTPTEEVCGPIPSITSTTFGNLTRGVGGTSAQNWTTANSAKFTPIFREDAISASVQPSYVVLSTGQVSFPNPQGVTVNGTLNTTAISAISVAAGSVSTVGGAGVTAGPLGFATSGTNYNSGVLSATGSCFSGGVPNNDVYNSYDSVGTGGTANTVFVLGSHSGGCGGTTGIQAPLLAGTNTQAVTADSSGNLGRATFSTFSLIAIGNGGTGLTSTAPVCIPLNSSSPIFTGSGCTAAGPSVLSPIPQAVTISKTTCNVNADPGAGQTFTWSLWTASSVSSTPVASSIACTITGNGTNGQTGSDSHSVTLLSGTYAFWLLTTSLGTGINTARMLSAVAVGQ